MMVGRLLSYWEGNFSGAMLNFGRVTSSRWWGCICQDSGGSKRSHWSHWRLWFCQGSSGVVNPEVTEIYNYPTPGCQICGKIKVLVWGSSQPTYPPPTYHDHFKKNTTTSSKHLLAKTLPDVFFKGGMKPFQRFNNCYFYTSKLSHIICIKFDRLFKRPQVTIHFCMGIPGIQTTNANHQSTISWFPPFLLKIVILWYLQIIRFLPGAMMNGSWKSNDRTHHDK